MSNQVQVRSNSKWSLFQAFCCGTKTSKKKTAATTNANNNIQSTNQNQQNNNSNIPSSPPQILLNHYSSIQNQNNQTNVLMRGVRSSYNQEDMDEVSSYSSNNQPQYQEQQNHQQYYQQNNIINIQNNRHQRQTSNYENHYNQSSNLTNHLAPPAQQGSQSQRRAQSVNYNSGNVYLSSSNHNSNINIHQQQQYSEQRLETQNSQASYSSQKSRYYTMSNQFFKLKTKFAIHEVDYVESRPTDKTFQTYFTYDCPICFRHFNKILKSDCCEHYLCHYCLRDIYNKARDSVNFDYRCMFCQLSIPHYIDVEDSADKIKRYSDSPFITPKDSITDRPVKPFTTTSQFDHNIHNNLIEFQDDSMDKENIDFKQNEINIINNCSTTHNINKPPLPHLVLNQNMQIPQIQQDNNLSQRRNISQANLREKTGSLMENENVNQSAHKPAGTIPEFQNKYHCNYLQHSNNQRVQGIQQITNQNSQQIHSNIRSIR